MGAAASKVNAGEENVTPTNAANRSRSSSFRNFVCDDPRSPSCKRTPLPSPHAHTTPPHHSLLRERLMHKYGSPNPLDPRSPSYNRTPLSQLGSALSPTSTPPPFKLSMNLADPRSPTTLFPRTPLHLTQVEEVVEDVIVVEKEQKVDMQASSEVVEIEEEEVVVVEVEEKKSVLLVDEEQEEEDETTEEEEESSSPIAVASMAHWRSIETLSSSYSSSTTLSSTTSCAEISPSPVLLALASSSIFSSALNSPSLASRKRKTDGASTLSPLKKSFSAPLDENSPSIRKSINMASTSTGLIRTPLSPLLVNTSTTNQLDENSPVLKNSGNLATNSPQKDGSRRKSVNASYKDEKRDDTPSLRKSITLASTSTNSNTNSNNNQQRTPLSPLSQRAIHARNHYVSVQPIKFRMDAGVVN